MLLETDEVFAKKNPVTGLIELISLETFEVVGIQKSTSSLLSKREEKMQKYTTASGKEVWIERGLTEDALGNLLGYPYSEVLVDLIAEQITEGESLTSICKKPGFPPYHIFARWMRKYPYAKEAVEQARKDRAEVMRDQMLEKIDAAGADSDEIALAKAQAEVRKWAASVDDRGRFGKDEQKQLVVSAQIIIDTGIRREGDAGFREVKETPALIGEEDAENKE